MAKKKKEDPGRTKFPVILVVWNDAAHYGVRSYETSQVPMSGMIMHTAGFLVGLSNEGVSVAMEVDTNLGHRNITFIPKGMVIKIATLADDVIDVTHQVFQVNILEKKK